MTFATIIVLYNCNIEKFSYVLQGIINQTDYLILVKNDNTIFPLNLLNNSKIHLIDLHNNFGIAYAQNRGVEYARKLQAKYLLFSDQDTIFPENYISMMKEKICSYQLNTIFAPVFFNNTKNQIEPLATTIKESVIPISSQPISVLHAISSGTVISLIDFEKIGFFDEDLFIDYVDFEWCWRARHFGYSILCFPDIQINHNLGDNYKILFGKKVTIRSNFRYYYMIRNGLILSKKTIWLNNDEKRVLRNRTVIMIFGIFFLNFHFIKNLKTVFLAIKDYRKYITIKQISKTKISAIITED